MSPRVLIVDDSLTVRMDLDEAFGAIGWGRRLAKDLASARADVVGYGQTVGDDDAVQVVAE